MDWMLENRAIQTAVVISALLSLPLLFWQLYIQAIQPSFSIFKNGLSAFLEKSKHNKDREISLSLISTTYLLGTIVFRSAGLINSIISLFVSGLLVLFGAMLYIPNYEESAGAILIVSINRDFLNYFAGLLFIVSAALSFSQLWSFASFGRSLSYKSLRTLVANK